MIMIQRVSVCQLEKIVELLWEFKRIHFWVQEKLNHLKYRFCQVIVKWGKTIAIYWSFCFMQHFLDSYQPEVLKTSLSIDVSFNT